MQLRHLLLLRMTLLFKSFGCARARVCVVCVESDGWGDCENGNRGFFFYVQ